MCGNLTPYVVYYGDYNLSASPWKRVSRVYSGTWASVSVSTCCGGDVTLLSLSTPQGAPGDSGRLSGVDVSRASCSSFTVSTPLRELSERMKRSYRQRMDIFFG